jgi:hypothetical protein
VRLNLRKLDVHANTVFAVQARLYTGLAEFIDDLLSDLGTDFYDGNAIPSDLLGCSQQKL